MNRRSRLPIVAMVLVGTLALGAGAGAVAYSVAHPSSTKTVVQPVRVQSSEPAAASTGLSVGQIYRDAYRGVVEITVSTNQATPMGNQQAQAQGSGFVIDGDGHIATNQHVVDGANSITVTFADGKKASAKVVGTDASTDVAVIKVDAPKSELHPLQFADSNGVLVGDGVVAIGSPFGLEGTVTTGIVSALNREIAAPDNTPIEGAIQTDAAINHGNSGGPLLTLDGKVIGVNAQIESDSGGSDGVGFAIPASTVRSIASQLIGSGSVKHSYLGVGIASAQDGVKLTEVRPGTPAAQAGLQTGDVVTAVGSRQVRAADELGTAIDAKKPGDRVTITYTRNGASHTVTVTLAERPA